MKKNINKFFTSAINSFEAAVIWNLSSFPRLCSKINSTEVLDVKP